MRLLVVEDDLAVRKSITLLLRRAGYDVIELDCTDPLIDEVDVDLLITDVVMPAKSGLEVARQLHQKIPGLPVLYMSGHDSGERLLRGLARGEELLRKPFRSAELLATVERLAPSSTEHK